MHSRVHMLTLRSAPTVVLFHAAAGAHGEALNVAGMVLPWKLTV